MRRVIIGVFLALFACHRHAKTTQPNTGPSQAVAENPPVAAKTAKTRAAALWQERDNPKQLEEAVSLYEKSAALEKDNADTWLQLAKSYEMSGRLQPETPDGQKKAFVQYQSGLEAAQKAMEALSKGSTDTAVPASERFGKLKKEDAETLYYYALLRWRWSQYQGKSMELAQREEILAAAKRVEELDPKMLGAAPYRFLGELYAELPAFADGNLKLSRLYFTMATEAAPDALENRGTCARTYAKKADPELALALWQEIQEADPEKIPALAPENRVEQKKAKEALSKIKTNK
jgi:hypothetical protein